MASHKLKIADTVLTIQIDEDAATTEHVQRMKVKRQVVVNDDWKKILEQEVDVLVPANVKAGQTLRIEGQGDESVGADTGDVVFIIEIVEAPFRHTDQVAWRYTMSWHQMKSYTLNLRAAVAELKSVKAQVTVTNNRTGQDYVYDHGIDAASALDQVLRRSPDRRPQGVASHAGAGREAFTTQAENKLKDALRAESIAEVEKAILAAEGAGIRTDIIDDARERLKKMKATKLAAASFTQEDIFAMSVLGHEDQAVSRSQKGGIRPEHSRQLGIGTEWVLKAFLKAARMASGAIKDEDVLKMTFHQLAPHIAYGAKALGKGRLCPRDRRDDCSIVDALFPYGLSSNATVFLSWVWGYTFEQVLAALRKHFEGNSQYLWWCFHQNNQFRLLEENQQQSPEALMAVFGGTLKSAGNMVCLMDRIEGSKYVKRAYCIYEVFVADQTGIPITIIRPPSDEFQTMLDNGGVTRVKKAVDINAETARATHPADENAIKGLITSQTTFTNVNAKVKTALIANLMNEMQALLQ